MNANRRKRIAGICDKIEDLKCEIEAILEEEMECFDNLPENLQSSERGEKMSEAIDNIENAITSIEEAMDYLIESSN